MPYSTITLPKETKARLALVKGSRSWGEFMDDILEDYPVEETVRELQRRIDDLQSGRFKGIPWEEVKRKLKRR